jgi:hypothetical protein
MLSWLRKMGLDEQVHAHLPYPMRPTTRDPYVDSAMRESELLSRLLEDVKSLPAADRSFALSVIASAFPHPCVRWEAERRTGLPVLGGSFPEASFPLAGTEYRSGNFVHASGTASEGDAFAVAVVECPRAAECALAPVCPKEHYSVYAEHHGLDEYAPVRPTELYGATPSYDSGRGGVWSIVRDAWRSKRSAPPR